MRLSESCPKLVVGWANTCFKKLPILVEAGRIRRTAARLLAVVSIFAGAEAWAANTYTVTTLDDTPGSCSGATCSTLRAALTAANASSGDTINFTGLKGTITLTSALPAITQGVTIAGPGANSLTVSGAKAYQIFNINNPSATVAISGLTLSNGTSPLGSGGAIESSATLTVTSCAFSDNFADYWGGAIESTGMLTVTSSTFTGNYASSEGGAIGSTGVAVVTDSTFSGNIGGFDAAGGGGAIRNFGTMTVTDSTFSANSGNYGAAIYNYGSSMTVENSILTGNSSQFGKGAGILSDSGTVNANYNLYYQNLDGNGSEDDCNGCTSNENAITGSNPLLADLSNNGGTTATLLPEPGSPVICSGSTTLIPSGETMDQRGFGRTTTYNSTKCVDLGAVQSNYSAVAFSSSSYSGIVNQPVNPAPAVTVTENGQNIGGVPITLKYSGPGSAAGLGPVTTIGGTGAAFSSLTVSSPGQGTLSVSVPITASGNPVQPSALTASATLNIPAPTFAISGGTPTISVAPGATTGNTIALTVTPSNGFTGTVALTCSITSAVATNSPTCSLSPSSVTITGTSAQTSTLAIVTTAPTTSGGEFKKLLWPSAGTALALIFGIGVPRRRRGWLTMCWFVAISMTFGATGCGGGGGGNGGGNTGTPAGSYTVTVAGTSGSVTGVGATFTLTVQ
jgi:CSLREA domain-containing protein